MYGFAPADSQVVDVCVPSGELDVVDEDVPGLISKVLLEKCHKLTARN